VAMMASMRWASAAAAGACSAVLAASDWACARVQGPDGTGSQGFGSGGWVGLVGPDSASDSASVGRCRTARAAERPGVRVGLAAALAGDLRAELVMLAAPARSR
jgi:hypothetical protein